MKHEKLIHLYSIMEGHFSKYELRGLYYLLDRLAAEDDIEALLVLMQERLKIDEKLRK